jgi:hypothetical protein
MIRLAGHVASTEQKYKILIENPGGMRPLGRPTHIWENNTEMDLEK